MIENDVLDRCASHIQAQEHLDAVAGHMVRSIVFDVMGIPSTAAAALAFLAVYERFDRALVVGSQEVETLRDDCLAAFGSLRKAMAGAP